MSLPAVVIALVLFFPPSSPAAASQVPADTLLVVNGHRLHLEVRRGTVPVTVVLEAGGAAEASSWARVPERIAERTGATVVAYDRAGLGSSELGPPDLTPGREVDQLREALDRLGVPRATILVGHSYGALLALDHAARHSGNVRGVVLVDPMNARFIEATGDFVESTVPDIENPATNREHVVVRMKRTFDELRARVADAEPRLEVPIVVVTAGEPWWGEAAIDSAWRASHEAIAAAAPDRSLVVARGSDHDVPGERPDVIVDAVVAVSGEAP